MAIRRVKGLLYADAQSDLPDVLRDYSDKTYPATHFADAVCECGCRTFYLDVDEQQGAAVRTCTQCDEPHPIGDSGDYLADAQWEACECTCDADAFEITVGVALYEDSQNVRWLFIGCRCPQCDLSGCYADWKNEFPGYHDLLAQV